MIGITRTNRRTPTEITPLAARRPQTADSAAGRSHQGSAPSKPTPDDRRTSNADPSSSASRWSGRHASRTTPDPQHWTIRRCCRSSPSSHHCHDEPPGCRQRHTRTRSSSSPASGCTCSDARYDSARRQICQVGHHPSRANRRHRRFGSAHTLPGSASLGEHAQVHVLESTGDGLDAVIGHHLGSGRLRHLRPRLRVGE